MLNGWRRVIEIQAFSMLRVRRGGDVIEWGDWEESEEGKREIITNYFESLFTSSNLGGAVDQLLNLVAPQVTAEMNDMLLRAFSREEIKVALDSIGDLKAPRPEGVPSVFYKQCWENCR
jgi:hypothetical protein